MKQTKEKGPQNELIFGANPIIEMLKAKRRRLLGIYTTKPLPRAWERIERYLPKSIPNIQYVTRDILDRMTGSREHMSVAAWVSPFQYQRKTFEPQKAPFILLLDAVQDVHNLGAILRSAYCTGVDGVVLCQKNSAPLTATALKASAGLAEHLSIHIAPSLKHAVLELKHAGYNMYMAVLEQGKNAMEVEFKKPMCLVIGNEAVGITKDIRGLGELITLPQKDPTASYNASVAAGICLFLLSQQGCTKPLAKK